MSDAPEGQKVTIVPEHTSITSGTDVQEKLIIAARVFSDLLKPTFGPKGLDKMLYKTDGNTAVTNDGAKIVAELMVKHPAAKMMVSMANTQEEQCGDGVTTTMLICGSLLIEANNLLRKGLHPLTLIEGYELAAEAAKSCISELSRNPSRQDLISVAETAMKGKGAESASDLFSQIIVEALEVVAKNRGHASSEHVSMFKSGSGRIRDSRLIRGIVVNRRILIDGLPNNFVDPNIACLDGDLKIRELTREIELKITNANELESFIGAEMDRRELIAKSIIESGTNVILCSGEIDKDILHYLSDEGILAIGELDSTEIRNAADSTRARILENPLDIGKEDLGSCGSLSWERREETEKVEDIVRIENCAKPNKVSIEVGGPSDIVTEEIIRGIYDALRVTSKAMNDQIVNGAGSIHIGMAQAVRHSAESQGGRERLAMEAFARALETIPATLAENAGGDPLDCILELRASARQGNDAYGISSQGKVGKIKETLHPMSVIEDSLISATETSIGMLRIDQVISARGN